MHTWYAAVCDKHKEYAHVFVTSTFHLRVDLLQDKREEKIINFLSNHYGCQLRLIHHDLDFEKIWAEDYIAIEKLDEYPISGEYNDERNHK